jgi:outer membrane protein assembly factor BamB
MTLSRRAALLALPFGLAGCSLFDDLLGDNKKPIAGKREAILGASSGLDIDPADRRVVSVPAPVNLAAWPQSGATLTHVVGNIAISGFKPAWNEGIGEGGGYRAKLTSQPVVLNGTVYTMDSDGEVAAIDLARGSRRWRVDTQADENRSTNIGGGVAVEGGTVYATTGRGEAMALEAATGRILWRRDVGVPARSGPTLSDGRMHFTTLDNQLLALTMAKGDRVWAYQGNQSPTTVLADAAPAIANGFVVCGFGSGELVTVRSDSGVLAWSDTLASSRGRNSFVDLSAIRAIGVGGLLVSLDLRSGRRLWEREIGGGQTPWISGDWLFVQSLDQSLAAISVDDGRVRWVQSLPRWDNPARQRDPIFWSGPLMASGKLILAGTSEIAVSIDPVSGHILGTQSLSGPVSIAPVAAEGTLLILCDDGTLQAFR